jgi:hypothetical protein
MQNVWEMRNTYKILVGKIEGKRRVGRTNLKCIFKKYDVRVWNGFSWFKMGSNGGDRPMDFIRSGDNLRDCHLLKKDSAPWSQVGS